MVGKGFDSRLTAIRQEIRDDGTYDMDDKDIRKIAKLLADFGDFDDLKVHVAFGLACVKYGRKARGGS